MRPDTISRNRMIRALEQYIKTKYVVIKHKRMTKEFFNRIAEIRQRKQIARSLIKQLSSSKNEFEFKDKELEILELAMFECYIRKE